MPQRLILEDDDHTYNVLIEPIAAASDASVSPNPSNEFETYDPTTSRGHPIKSPELRVKLREVHETIRGYTTYAIGAFKNLAIAEVEELNLKFKLKITAEAGLPMLASSKSEADFEIEVKCKFKG